MTTPGLSWPSFVTSPVGISRRRGAVRRCVPSITDYRNWKPPCTSTCTWRTTSSSRGRYVLRTLASGPSSDSAGSTAGNPTVRATPVTAGGSGAAGGLTALGAPGVVDQSSGVNPAALAAPLGLAGLGAAGLGALRGRGSDESGEGELLDLADLDD